MIFNKKKNQKGIALLLAMTSLILMIYIASEVTKDTTIEYVVNSQEINRIKAYYAARNSLGVALLRIKIYQQVAQMNLPPGFAQEIDQLWKFPFAWPLPTLGISTGNAENSEKKSQAALFDGQYDQSILDEGSKIDLNDLNSPSEILRKTTSQQLLNIFEQQIESNPDFRNTYQNYNFTELINRITDWMTDNQDYLSKNGGDKRNAYQDLDREEYPPNRGFRTLDELRLVPGMSEEFFNLLTPQVTIYGMKAINPNLANGKVLKSLDKGLTDEAIKNVLERIDDPEKGGPFKGSTSDECRKEFKIFVEGFGSQLSSDFDKIPFSCDKILNFKIQATGRSGSGKGSVQKKINVVVVDINKVAEKIKSYVAKELKDSKAVTTPDVPVTPAAGPRSDTVNKEPLPKGPPRIIYWSEF